jgi:epoxyqueuosine reductase
MMQGAVFHVDPRKSPDSRAESTRRRSKMTSEVGSSREGLPDAVASAPLEAKIRGVAAALGFDAVGFTGAEPTERTRYLREWVRRGFAGEMHYIERRLEERVDPRRVLPEARSIIVVGLYSPGEAAAGESSSAAADPEARHGEPRRGRIARYAGGDDYHDVILDRLRCLESALPALAGRPFRSRSYVDTGPVSERAAAAAAGLGWIGKNSCLIDPELGSHLMLGVILTELELEPDVAVADHCGTCRACLDVCPTDAFPEPYVLDATRCISYTTIETRGAIPEPLREAQGDHVFGCDLCQTVCPWNKSRPKHPPGDPLGLRTRLSKRPEWTSPSLAWLLALDEDEFDRASRKTAIRRSGWRGLLRNALVAAGNSRDPSLIPLIERFVGGEDAMLREHASWALAQLEDA